MRFLDCARNDIAAENSQSRGDGCEEGQQAARTRGRVHNVRNRAVAPHVARMRAHMRGLLFKESSILLHHQLTLQLLLEFERYGYHNEHTGGAKRVYQGNGRIGEYEVKDDRRHNGDDGAPNSVSRLLIFFR